MDEGHKSWVRKKLEEAFHAAVIAALNDTKAAAKAATVKSQFPGMPKDALAQILTKRAARKTMIEGAANGAAITAAEGALTSPEPASKPLILSGIGALLVADISYTTKIQMQLLLEIGEVYGCPFDKEDEDDVWLILKTAFGLKGTEKVGAFGRFVFTEAAKKQFRKLLRKEGIRRAAQQAVAKVAGKEVAKYVSEKALMQLIPFANAVIGGWFNRRVTKGVGRWAKTKSKIRASTFDSIGALNPADKEARKWVLPTIFHIGTADERLVDNTITLYSQAAKRLALDETELAEAHSLADDEKLDRLLIAGLEQVSIRRSREEILNIAIVSAASINLEFSEAHHLAVERLSKSLRILYSRNDLEKKIAYLRQ